MTANPYDPTRDSAALPGAAFDDEARYAEAEHDGFSTRATAAVQPPTDYTSHDGPRADAGNPFPEQP